MKKIFCAVLALAAMASCSNEYTIDYNKQAIGFGDTFVNNGTRADYSQVGKPVQAFKVWGTLTGTGNYSGTTVQVFNDVDVIKPEGYYEDGVYNPSKVWIYTGTQYWVPNTTYNFAAIVDGVADETTGLPETIEFTVTDGNGDLLYATASAEVDNYGTVTGTGETVTGTGTGTEGKTSIIGEGVVAFQFDHLLSKLQFNAPTHNMGSDYTIEVTDIKVSKVLNSGVYTVSGGTWAKADGAVYNVVLDFVSANDTYESHQIIPLAQELDVTINYIVKFKGTPISAVEMSGTIPSTQTYAKGLVYAITPIISANEIQFSVRGVNGWDSAGGNLNVQ